jgi:hypothetical protein
MSLMQLAAGGDGLAPSNRPLHATGRAEWTGLSLTDPNSNRSGKAVAAAERQQRADLTHLSAEQDYYPARAGVQAALALGGTLDASSDEPMAMTIILAQSEMLAFAKQANIKLDLESGDGRAFPWGSVPAAVARLIRNNAPVKATYLNMVPKPEAAATARSTGGQITHYAPQLQVAVLHSDDGRCTVLDSCSSEGLAGVSMERSAAPKYVSDLRDKYNTQADPGPKEQRKGSCTPIVTVGLVSCRGVHFIPENFGHAGMLPLLAGVINHMLEQRPQLRDDSTAPQYGPDRVASLIAELKGFMVSGLEARQQPQAAAQPAHEDQPMAEAGAVPQNQPQPEPPAQPSSSDQAAALREALRLEELRVTAAEGEAADVRRQLQQLQEQPQRAGQPSLAQLIAQLAEARGNSFSLQQALNQAQAQLAEEKGISATLRQGQLQSQELHRAEQTNVFHLQLAHSQLQAQLASERNISAGLRQDLALLETQLDEARNSNAGLQRDLQHQQAGHRNASDAAAQRAQELAQLHTRLREAEQQYKQASEAEDRLREARNALQLKCAALEQEVGEGTERLAEALRESRALKQLVPPAALQVHEQHRHKQQQGPRQNNNGPPVANHRQLAAPGHGEGRKQPTAPEGNSRRTAAPQQLSQEAEQAKRAAAVAFTLAQAEEKKRRRQEQGAASAPTPAPRQGQLSPAAPASVQLSRQVPSGQAGPRAEPGNDRGRTAMEATKVAGASSSRQGGPEQKPADTPKSPPPDQVPDRGQQRSAPASTITAAAGAGNGKTHQQVHTAGSPWLPGVDNLPADSKFRLVWDDSLKGRFRQLLRDNGRKLTPTDSGYQWSKMAGMVKELGLLGLGFVEEEFYQYIFETLKGREGFLVDDMTLDHQKLALRIRGSESRLSTGQEHTYAQFAEVMLDNHLAWMCNMQESRWEATPAAAPGAEALTVEDLLLEGEDIMGTES